MQKTNIFFTFFLCSLFLFIECANSALPAHQNSPLSELKSKLIDLKQSVGTLSQKLGSVSLKLGELKNKLEGLKTEKKVEVKEREAKREKQELEPSESKKESQEDKDAKEEFENKLLNFLCEEAEIERKNFSDFIKKTQSLTPAPSPLELRQAMNECSATTIDAHNTESLAKAIEASRTKKINLSSKWKSFKGKTAMGDAIEGSKLLNSVLAKLNLNDKKLTNLNIKISINPVVESDSKKQAQTIDELKKNFGYKHKVLILTRKNELDEFKKTLTSTQFELFKKGYTSLYNESEAATILNTIQLKLFKEKINKIGKQRILGAFSHVKSKNIIDESILSPLENWVNSGEIENKKLKTIHPENLYFILQGLYLGSLVITAPSVVKYGLKIMYPDIENSQSWFLFSTDNVNIVLFLLEKKYTNYDDLYEEISNDKIAKEGTKLLSAFQKLNDDFSGFKESLAFSQTGKNYFNEIILPLSKSEKIPAEVMRFLKSLVGSDNNYSEKVKLLCMAFCQEIIRLFNEKFESKTQESKEVKVSIQEIEKRYADLRFENLLPHHQKNIEILIENLLPTRNQILTEIGDFKVAVVKAFFNILVNLKIGSSSIQPPIKKDMVVLRDNLKVNKKEKTITSFPLIENVGKSFEYKKIRSSQISSTTDIITQFLEQKDFLKSACKVQVFESGGGNIFFANESGQDVGGLTRDFLTIFPAAFFTETFFNIEDELKAYMPLKNEKIDNINIDDITFYKKILIEGIDQKELLIYATRTIQNLAPEIQKLSNALAEEIKKLSERLQSECQEGKENLASKSNELAQKLLAQKDKETDMNTFKNNTETIKLLLDDDEWYARNDVDDIYQNLTTYNTDLEKKLKNLQTLHRSSTQLDKAFLVKRLDTGDLRNKELQIFKKLTANKTPAQFFTAEFMGNHAELDTPNIAEIWSFIVKEIKKSKEEKEEKEEKESKVLKLEESEVKTLLKNIDQKNALKSNKNYAVFQKLLEDDIIDLLKLEDDDLQIAQIKQAKGLTVDNQEIKTFVKLLHGYINQREEQLVKQKLQKFTPKIINQDIQINYKNDIKQIESQKLTKEYKTIFNTLWIEKVEIDPLLESEINRRKEIYKENYKKTFQAFGRFLLLGVINRLSIVLPLPQVFYAFLLDKLPKDDERTLWINLLNQFDLRTYLTINNETILEQIQSSLGLEKNQIALTNIKEGFFSNEIKIGTEEAKRATKNFKQDILKPIFDRYVNRSQSSLQPFESKNLTDHNIDVILALENIRWLTPFDFSECFFKSTIDAKKLTSNIQVEYSPQLTKEDKQIANAYTDAIKEYLHENKEDQNVLSNFLAAISGSRVLTERPLTLEFYKEHTNGQTESSHTCFFKMDIYLKSTISLDQTTTVVVDFINLHKTDKQKFKEEVVNIIKKWTGGKFTAA